MAKVIRHQIADYLNTAPSGEAAYSLMGTGYTALDENPSAKVDNTAYVSDKASSATITGYENSFKFDSQLISDDATIAYLYSIGRDQKTGSDAETDYVRVDLFDAATSGAYKARKFRVAVEISSISGAGNEIVKVSGSLHQIGDAVQGTFNPTTKTFTASST